MTAEPVRVAFDALKRTLRERPDLGIGTDSFARARLEGGLVTVAEGPTGQRITTDMPASIGGTGAAPSPGWYFRAGIASCTATVIALRAAECSIALDHLEVHVESRSNDCGMVGVDDGVPPGPFEARMRVDVRAGGATPEEIEELVRWGVRHSPMADALTRAVPLEVVVRVS